MLKRINSSQQLYQAILNLLIKKHKNQVFYLLKKLLLRQKIFPNLQSNLT